MLPADINALVVERDRCRLNRDYVRADEIKTQLEKENVEITDISYKFGGGSTWKIKKKPIVSLSTNLMELAHMSYWLLASISSKNIAEQAKDALKFQCYQNESDSFAIPNDHQLRSSEMQGRKYADAAFEFSMAGITDNELFTTLADCTDSELRRFGLRSTCKPVSILQMIEKLAVAGIRNHVVFDTARDILSKRCVDSNILRPLLCASTNGNDSAPTFDEYHRYSLFSLRPLLWLWRYAAKQTKPCCDYNIKHDDNEDQGDDNIAPPPLLLLPLPSISHYAAAPTRVSDLPTFDTLFRDAKLPLVLDLGCGYGITLLHLCDKQCSRYQPMKQGQQQAQGQGQATQSENIYIDKNTKYGDALQYRRQCNYLGIDLSHRSITYANGIAQRWGMASYCAFQYVDCHTAIEWIQRMYPGPLALVFINFPTPYNIAAVLTTSSNSSSSRIDINNNTSNINSINDSSHTNSSINNDTSNTDNSININSIIDTNIIDIDTNNVAKIISLTDDTLDCNSTTDTLNDKDYTVKESFPSNNNNNIHTASSGGNSQLPSSFDSFMCNPALIQSILQLFHTTSYRLPPPSPLNDEIVPCILLQSNVEDVAVTMRNIVENVQHRNDKSSNNSRISDNNSCKDIAAVGVPDDISLPAVVATTTATAVVEKGFRLPVNPKEVEDVMKRIIFTDTCAASSSGDTTAIATTTTITSDLPTCSSSGIPPMKWVTEDDLVSKNDCSTVAATTVTTIDNSHKRASQRLALWLDNLSLSSPNTTTTTTYSNSSIDDDIKGSSNHHHHPSYGRQRACGPGWLNASPLPMNVRTETEAQCAFENKPVHRIVFVYKR